MLFRSQQQRQSLDGSLSRGDGSGRNSSDASRSEERTGPSQEQSEFGSSTQAPFVDGDSTVRRPPNLDVIKQRLRVWSEQTAVVIRNRADDFTTRSKETFSQLGAHLNKVTGYEEIEARKGQVVRQGVYFFNFFFFKLRIVFGRCAYCLL